MSELELKKQAEKFFTKAYEHQMRGEFKEAIGCYKKSIELFPTAEAYTFLGWTYSFMGMLDEAIAECKKAIEIGPDFGNPYNDIGAYLIEKGELDEAIPWLQKAMDAKRYESRMFPHYNLGRIWEMKGKYTKAVECYQQALKENPDYNLAQAAIGRLKAMLN